MDEAVAVLKNGGIIAYPTEAVWGLGCDFESLSAVSKLQKIKERPRNRGFIKGFILVAGNWREFATYLPHINQEDITKISAATNHPCTWLVEDKAGNIPAIVKGGNNIQGGSNVQGGSNKVAIRISHNPVVSLLAKEFGKPLVSTSANISGHPPALDSDSVKEYFGEQVDYIVPGDIGNAAAVSDIRDLSSGEFLRKESK